jgi:hypothetical protein
MRITRMASYLALLLSSIPAWADGNYKLTINGATIELDLDSERNLTLPNGPKLTLKLERKTTNIFTAKGVSFEHPGALNVATSEISKTITQHLMASALGSLVIVQTYADLDATQLVDLMTGKMTESDVAGGATIDTKPFSRTLGDGRVIKGTRSTLKAVGGEAIVEVMAVKQGQGGRMMITRIDPGIAPDEGAIIERFWQTLVLQ